MREREDGKMQKDDASPETATGKSLVLLSELVSDGNL